MLIFSAKHRHCNALRLAYPQTITVGEAEDTNKPPLGFSSEGRFVLF